MKHENKTAEFALEGLNFSIFVLEGIINHLNKLEKGSQLIDWLLSSEALIIADYVRLANIAQKLKDCIALLQYVNDPTTTRTDLESVHAECVNRMCLFSVVGKLDSEDLICDLKKYAVNRLPILKGEKA
jgi:hypothetical protein